MKERLKAFRMAIRSFIDRFLGIEDRQTFDKLRGLVGEGEAS